MVFASGGSSADAQREQIDRRAPAWGRVAHLSGLRNELIRPRSGAVEIFGRLIRGDADTCAHDAREVVRAVRPELLASGE